MKTKDSLLSALELYQFAYIYYINPTAAADEIYSYVAL